MIKVKVSGDDNDGATEKPVKKKKRKVSDKQPSLMVIIPKGSKAARRNDNRPRMPNPWPPTDIVPLLKMACIVPVAKAVLELIKLWIEDRKSRKIKIKHGEFELEIQGGVTTRMLKKKFDEFRKLTKDMDEDDDKVRIILPPGVDRSLPTKYEGGKSERMPLK